MKQLLIIITLAAWLSACGGGASLGRGAASFNGSLRSLTPQQVGEFKLAGEVKSLDIPQQGGYQSGAIHPTDGVAARYEAPGKGPLSLQIVNYPSPAAAEQALAQWKENVSRVGKGATFSETTGGARKPAQRGILVEGLTPGVHYAIWIDGSLLYQVVGDNLQNIQTFQQGLP